MNEKWLQSNVFFSQNSIFSLAGAGLAIMASSRLAFAITVALALVWVYALTSLIAALARPILPKSGKTAVLIFLSSLIGSIFLFLVWLVSPFLAMEGLYLVILVPCCFVGSDTFKSLEASNFIEALFDALREAGMLSAIIIGLSLIREPFGFYSLSLPGGPLGIIELFKAPDEASFLPIRILSTSAGAFLLLGYVMAILLTLKRRYSSKEEV
jgi:Na+-transporting NADH:ubiquinone oxidoreductase subunit NqrD